MNSVEIKLGRSFGVTFEHGKNFFDELSEFFKMNNLKQAFIPMFIAGFQSVEMVGACEKLEDPNAPVWSKVYLENVEVIGGGTVAYDEKSDKILPHIHISVGIKPQSGSAYTSHLLDAKVQFLTEMLVLEVISPKMERVVDTNLYNIALLKFRNDT